MGPGAQKTSNLWLDPVSLRAPDVGTRLYLSRSTMPHVEHDFASDWDQGAFSAYTAAVITIACELSLRVFG